MHLKLPDLRHNEYHWLTVLFNAAVLGVISITRRWRSPPSNINPCPPPKKMTSPMFQDATALFLLSCLRMKMTGKGIKRMSGYGVGDHYINIKIKPPKRLSDKQKALLQVAAIVLVVIG